MCAKCLATGLAYSKYSKDNNHWWILLIISTIIIITIVRLICFTFKMYLESSYSDLPIGYHNSSCHYCPLPGVWQYPSELSFCFHPFLPISHTAARVILLNLFLLDHMTPLLKTSIVTTTTKNPYSFPMSLASLSQPLSISSTMPSTHLSFVPRDSAIWPICP